MRFADHSFRPCRINLSVCTSVNEIYGRIRRSVLRSSEVRRFVAHQVATEDCISMNDVSLAGAFLAGLVSFLSPCVLPLVPGYISMLSGIGMEQLRKGEVPSSS